MDILHNNFTGLSGQPLEDMGTYIEKTQEEEKDGKLVGVLDKIFGYAGQASTIWGNVQAARDDKAPQPYDLDVKVGDRPTKEKRVLGMPATTGYIIIGLSVIIVGVIIYKQANK